MGFGIVVVAFVTGCGSDHHTCRGSCPSIAFLEGAHGERVSATGGNHLGRGNAYHGLAVTLSSEARCILLLVRVLCHPCYSRGIWSVDERRCWLVAQLSLCFAAAWRFPDLLLLV